MGEDLCRRVEQVESTHADARSDVYSMGVMMFELLTGRTPFHGDSPLALAYQRLTFDVPAPGDVIAGVPVEFDEIVLRATERNPADRYADGFEMQRALLAVADDLDLPPFTVPAPTRSREREVRSRYHAVGPAVHGTRVQSAPGPYEPGSSSPDSPATPIRPVAGVGDPSDDRPAPPARRRVTTDVEDTRDQDPLEPELSGGGRLGALLWILLVLLLAVGLGVAGFWAGNTYLTIG